MWTGGKASGSGCAEPIHVDQVNRTNAASPYWRPVDGTNKRGRHMASLSSRWLGRFAYGNWSQASEFASVTRSTVTARSSDFGSVAATTLDRRKDASAAHDPSSFTSTK